MPAPLPPKTRITSNSIIDRTTGCWNWHRAAKDGYGRIGIDYKNWLAHRASYFDFVGPIPDGLTIDHKCFNRQCVNPDHLEAVTQQENNSRAARAGKMDRKSANTACKNGHEYTPRNTNITPQGWRECRTCAREKSSRIRAEKSARRILCHSA